MLRYLLRIRGRTMDCALFIIYRPTSSRNQVLQYFKSCIPVCGTDLSSNVINHWNTLSFQILWINTTLYVIYCVLFYSLHYLLHKSGCLRKPHLERQKSQGLWYCNFAVWSTSCQENYFRWVGIIHQPVNAFFSVCIFVSWIGRHGQWSDFNLSEHCNVQQLK